MSKSNINDVIKQMFEIIPKKESILINELKEYSDNTWNIAPELLSNKEYFVAVAIILNNNISNIDCNWKKELVKIFNNL